MQDHRSATIASLVESLLPWVRIRHGRRKHVRVYGSPAQGFVVTLCGGVFGDAVYDMSHDVFVWNGRRTEAPARDFPVCGNCANVARAIVTEAEEQ